MRLITKIMFVASLILGAAPAWAAIMEKEATYVASGVTLKGYLAMADDATANRPGVLVVHEWWGLNDYARQRAHMLAELGYVALAVDMYGDGKVATHPKDAKAFAQEALKDFPTAKGRFEAAMKYLSEQAMVDKNRIAAIGYCFGGGVVLNMARQGVGLKGVASFHGSLDPAQTAVPGKIHAKILVLNGSDDAMSPPDKVKAFEEEMTQAKADFKVISYPKALHGFTNPDADRVAKEFQLPVAYNADVDHQSWQALQTFLKTIFAQQ
ncbi:MAG: dienelactone hydrolase family protein [Magnetococcales bacterium]|nr:dienelactone hydrolase family protein [Magnetococcales bacterium]